MKKLMWFKAEDEYYINNRGWIYTGPNPYTFKIDKRKDKDWSKNYFCNKEWLISYPGLSKMKSYEVTGVETYCTFVIHPNDIIGLLIKER